MQTIERDIPVPAPRTYVSHSYPFRYMKPGESVFFQGATNRGHERNAAKAFFRNHGWVIRTRTENGGVRVWRVA